MKRNRRTRILVEGNPTLARNICVHIRELCDVRVICEPRVVLVMNKVRESAHNSLFYLGEALMTECRVNVSPVNVSPVKDSFEESVTGIGLILGEHRERAFDLAVIDAAFSLPTPLSAHAQWLALLKQEELRLERLKEQRRAELEATRVEFTSMVAEED